jgi:DNA modification methylase
MTEFTASAAQPRPTRVAAARAPSLQGPDIHPYTPIAALDRAAYVSCTESFAVTEVSPLVGMAESFIRRIFGSKTRLTVQDVLTLLDQDAFSETFVPRSRIIDYLLGQSRNRSRRDEALTGGAVWTLTHGDVLDVVDGLPLSSVQCVVTSTPYWGMRIYKEARSVRWADGEDCAFGHEQTPEGFIRHTVEILHRLKPILTASGSIWWNLMDTYMTRTQIRGNAYEALQAMDGRNRTKWGEHTHHRYSAGHSYVKDGEQCGIPARVADRASRIGYFVKSTITWAKVTSLPEPQTSRVSRNLEYILHLSTRRAPKFSRAPYRLLSAGLGGRNQLYEADKLSDVWMLPVSSGGDGHGAQFPTALPGRCISISTDPGDLVLDPFVGSGTAGVAALSLGRRFLGVDVSREYLAIAESKIGELERRLPVDVGTGRRPAKRDDVTDASLTLDIGDQTVAFP